MTKLAENLFPRRFQDLMEIGRARLPALAPDWTDHNAHDPGIMLMELLAWVAEAQLYSLSRMRRDERASYAALLGVAPHGSRAASGLLWSDRTDPSSPALRYVRSIVLPRDAAISVVAGEGQVFRPTHSLLWAPLTIVRVESVSRRGNRVDLTAANNQGGVPFLPFGVRASSGDVLSIAFECRDPAGLLGANRKAATGACLSIGVQSASPASAPREHQPKGSTCRCPMSATLVMDQVRFDLPIKVDSTQGFLTTGVFLLDLDELTRLPEDFTLPKEFTIELCSPTNFPRPPRVVRIEPNVIPIRQGRCIWQEPQSPNGHADWSFQLRQSGLQFDGADAPVSIEIVEGASVKPWERCDRLSDRGPQDEVYELDASTGVITFGNGVNGKIPPPGSQAYATYCVSDGQLGGVVRNRKWRVAGFEGAFGVNPEAITGGGAPSDLLEQRREARRRARLEHALVTSDDLVEAALDLRLLEVARAWVPTPGRCTPRTGVTTLVALRSRPAGYEQEKVSEPLRWLEAIRGELAPRLPLGSRLVVVAPRYVSFSIDMTLEAAPGRDPAAIAEAAKKELRKRLALVEPEPGVAPRQPGAPVSRSDVAAWMRGVADIRRVVKLTLRTDGGRSTNKIAVPKSGLLKWELDQSTIVVQRSKPGRQR
jgi:hypothetical protein